MNPSTLSDTRGRAVQRQAALRVDLEKRFTHIWRNVQRYVELADGVDEGDAMSS